METENYAPIGVSTYKRLNHLKQTMDSLKRNYLADKSELYIFSDGPKEGDEKEVNEVRKYLKTIDGFYKVHIIERKKNDRVFNNRNRQKVLLEKYGKAIFLEEDIVTAPGFLNYMNEALLFYNNDKKVFSITGYCPPFKSVDSDNSDIYILNRFNAWGNAITHNNYKKIWSLSQKEMCEYIGSKKNRNQIKKYLGEDALGMIKKDAMGEIDAFDIKMMFYQIKNNLFTLYPKKSLTINIGHDGTGLHCGTTNKFETKLWNKRNDFVFKNNLELLEENTKENYNFRKISLIRKFKMALKNSKLYKELKRN